LAGHASNRARVPYMDGHRFTYVDHPMSPSSEFTIGKFSHSPAGRTLSLAIAFLSRREDTPDFGMPTRNSDTEPPLHLILAVYVLCLLILPFVAVYVFGSKCRGLLRRGLA
jgi:hypothetical protein